MSEEIKLEYVESQKYQRLSQGFPSVVILHDEKKEIESYNKDGISKKLTPKALRKLSKEAEEYASYLLMLANSIESPKPRKFAINERVQIPVRLMEFNNGGNTIWVQSPTGQTVLRIKGKKVLVDNGCQNTVSHADIMVSEDIHVCIANDAEAI